MISIVQSVLVGSVSTSGLFAGSSHSWQFPFTVSGSFPVPTTAGNTIVAVIFSTAQTDDNTTNADYGGGNITGISATVNGTESGQYVHATGGGNSLAAVFVEFSANAAALSPSDILTAHLALNDFNSNSAPTATSAKADLVLFELAGVAVQTNDAGSFADNSSGSPSPVQTPNATTSNTDAIFAAFVSQEAGGQLPAGSGYTLGPSAIDATIGQCEYWLNAPPGTYNGNFGGSESYFSVAFIALAPAAASTPILIVSPLTLNYSAQQYGPNPSPQNFAISNGDGGTLNWVITSDSSWLSPSVSSGTGNASVAANVNVSGLSPGSYTGHFTVTAAGATGSPQVVTVNLQILGSTGGGGGGGGKTPCILSYQNGLFVPNLSLYIQPATALYTQPISTTAIRASESVAQGRNAIVLDFNDSEGVYARDLGIAFTWPITSGTILDLWQPTIIPEQDDLYNRLSYHFLINALGLTGWGHIRELNIAHNAVSDITLLLQFDQWPDITLTIPSSGGDTVKVKVVLPPNKFKMVEGWLSSSQPFMLWAESCECKLGQWGRTDGYRVLKPFSG